MLVKEQADRFLTEIQTRNRLPVKPSTARQYGYLLNHLILPEMANMQLSSVENGTMKTFVAGLVRKGLSPATVNATFGLLKQVISSAVDGNGNELYPRTWNLDYIDLPVLTGQNRPIALSETVTGTVLGGSGQFRAMVALLAASGLRIGELRALKADPSDTDSYWDRDSGIIYVKTTADANGRIQASPKTAAGVRQVDLPTSINNFLRRVGLPPTGYLFQSSSGSPTCLKTAYSHLEEVGISGFHSLRRFRLTHLASQNVPYELIQYWAGHSINMSITGRYIQIGKNISIRKEWVEKAGTGFDLPK